MELRLGATKGCREGGGVASSVLGDRRLCMGYKQYQH